MITRRSLLGYALLTPFSAHSAPRWADFYVSTFGNDAWSGRLPDPSTSGDDGPLASLHEVKRRIAELRRHEPDRDRAVIVSIRGGIYALERPIVFGPEDSGAPKSPNIFEAFASERPVFSGGRRIDRWEVTHEGHWRATLPDVKAGKWSFAQLFVDDQRRFRPRLPKLDYFKTVEEAPQNMLRYGDGDIEAEWTNLNDVEILVFHDWSASRMRILMARPSAGEAIFSGSMWTRSAKKCRFQADNVREALTEPGQWYLDRPAGQLIYIPKAGESPGKSVVIAPRLDQLLVLQGDLAKRRWVQHLQFRGLSFAHSNWTLPAAGQSFPQAEIGLDAALVAFGARNISFERCCVRHTGGYGVAFGLASKENRLESCELVDLGGGGVKIGHAGAGDWDEVGRLSDDPEMHVDRHVVRNCLIAHGGRLHPAAVGVWIGQASANTIEHNEIFDFYQTGVSVGWTWGYGRSDAHDNEIAFNLIHTIGQRVLSDMGGIYTLGAQPGTNIHDNHIHDIYAYDYGGWGLYADEGSSGVVMHGNLVHDTQTGGFYQHYGKENSVTNNVFAFATQCQLQGPDIEPHVSFRFERNVVLWDNNSPLLLPKCPPHPSQCGLNFVADYNVYWNILQPPQFPGGLTLEQWRELSGQDAHSIVADPLLVDPTNGDFRFKATSPALSIGMRPLEALSAGRQEKQGLTKNLSPAPAAYP